MKAGSVTGYQKKWLADHGGFFVAKLTTKNASCNTEGPLPKQFVGPLAAFISTLSSCETMAEAREWAAEMFSDDDPQ